MRNPPRRWRQRLLELFVMEVHLPDGSTSVISVDPMGFGECWLPIEITTDDGGVRITA